MSTELLARPVEAVMTPAPLVIEPGELASAALGLMSRGQITVLFVVDAGVPVGVLHIHDVLRAGVV